MSRPRAVANWSRKWQIALEQIVKNATEIRPALASNNANTNTTVMDWEPQDHQDCIMSDAEGASNHTNFSNHSEMEGIIRYCSIDTDNSDVMEWEPCPDCDNDIPMTQAN
ncbi:hypothetical protein PWT90_03922 [Aphanocladium album]|nr:hypothetical protein PWT90_03922 [Aphanocladium album]